jgi:phage terminase large subunit
LSKVKRHELVYRPAGAAMLLFYEKRTEVLIEGPAGTGKTRAILEKVYWLCDRYPGMRALICRKTRKSMTESVLVTFEEKVLPPGSPLASGPSRSHRDIYKHPNGSEIIVGGLDHPERLFSTEFDLICVFEATECTLDDYESLHRALRNGVMPYQQIVCDCNPAYPSHWLYQRATVKGSQMRRLKSRHEDNPACTKAYLKILSELTGVRRERLFLGRWIAAEGAVWPEYDPAIHVIDRFDFHPEWRRIRSIDYGYTNPFTCQWWIIDGDGRMYLYRELYFTRRIVEDHVKQIVELSKGEVYEATIADHDAEDRATAERHGVSTIPALKAVTVGLQAVANRIHVAGDGRPRIFLLRDSLVERDPALVAARKPTCLAEEIESYLWQEPKEGKAAKEEPIKTDDHGVDAMRYATMYLDGAATPGISGFEVGAEKKEGVASDGGWCTIENEAIWTEW